MDKEQPPSDLSPEASPADPEEPLVDNVVDMADFILARQGDGLGSRHSGLVKKLWEHRHPVDSGASDDTPPTDTV